MVAAPPSTLAAFPRLPSTRHREKAQHVMKNFEVDESSRQSRRGVAKEVNARLSSAPLVCKIILLFHSSPPICASCSANTATASSGAAINTTRVSKIKRESFPKGRPAPMYLAARRAVDSERVTTEVMCQPASRSCPSNARPTRPAPTMEIDVGVTFKVKISPSILCSMSDGC